MNLPHIHSLLGLLAVLSTSLTWAEQASDTAQPLYRNGGHFGLENSDQRIEFPRDEGEELKLPAAETRPLPTLPPTADVVEPTTTMVLSAEAGRSLQKVNKSPRGKG